MKMISSLDSEVLSSSSFCLEVDGSKLGLVVISLVWFLMFWLLILTLRRLLVIVYLDLVFCSPNAQLRELPLG